MVAKNRLNFGGQLWKAATSLSSRTPGLSNWNTRNYGFEILVVEQLCDAQRGYRAGREFDVVHVFHTVRITLHTSEASGILYPLADLIAHQVLHRLKNGAA